MRRIAIFGMGAFLALALAGTTLAAQSINLGSATSFALLAGTTITNTGETMIYGNVGLHPGSAAKGLTTVTLHGTKHLADAVALQAKNALVTAYDEAAGATPVRKVPTELGGKTLKPGVYSSAHLGLTGTLTLDGPGVYIFKVGSTLITASHSRVVLINGASSCNVFWQIGSSATLGTTTSFNGTIMALASISLKTGATLQGRAFARNGAVTMDHNTINTAGCAAPATDAIAATSAPIPMASAPLLVILLLAFAGSLRVAARRSRRSR